jgi:hypothetical protein
LFRPLTRRRYLSVTALAIGTMAPDFEYLLYLEPRRVYGHSPFGLLVFCLPLGLLALLLWSRLLRGPVGELLGFPPQHDRISVTLHDCVRDSLSIVLGAATHLLWDSFTHRGGWGGAFFPALEDPAFRFETSVVPWYEVMQHVSTVIGGSIVLHWLWMHSKRGRSASRFWSGWRISVLSAIALMAALAATINTSIGDLRISDYNSVQAIAGRAAIGLMWGTFLGLVGYAVVARPIAVSQARPKACAPAAGGSQSPDAVTTIRQISEDPPPQSAFGG